jgi:hypothetical protein
MVRRFGDRERAGVAGAGRGVALTDGAGVFHADLTTVGGLKPAIDAGVGWRGRLALSVKNEKTASSAFRFARGAAICSKNLDDKKGREAYQRAFRALDLKIGGSHICRLFGAASPEQMSAKEIARRRRACAARAAATIPPPRR